MITRRPPCSLRHAALLLTAALVLGTAGSAQKLPVVNLTGPVYDGNGGPLLGGKVYVLQSVAGFPPSGKTLTVRGAIIKVPASVDVGAGGNLQCDGAKFTSLLDDSLGGDSNGDGAKTSPKRGDWGKINLGGQGSRVTNTDVFYGGKQSGAVHVANTQILLDRVTVVDSGADGIEVATRGMDKVQNCNVQNGAGVAYRVGWFEDVQNFVNNRAAGNKRGDYCLFEHGGNLGTMTLGKQHTVNGLGVFVIQAGLPGGQALVVPQGKTLTIPPGLLFKFSGNSQMSVDGGLRADGDIFTSIDDDTVGGDTQKNGTTVQPSPGQWVGVVMTKSGGSNATMRGCTVRYAGSKAGQGGVAISKDDAGLWACTVERCLGPGVSFSSSFNATEAPALTECTIRDNGGVAITGMPWRALTRTTRTVTTNNQGGDHFEMERKSVINQYAISVRRENLPKNRVLTLPDGLGLGMQGSLALPPGAILKFFDGTGLTLGASSRIQFVGWPQSPVILTSIHDDTAGGNSDGSSTKQPAPGDWDGVQIGSSGSNKLRDVRIRYAGGTNPSLRVSGTVELSSVWVEHGKGVGVEILERGTDVHNLVVWNCTGDGIDLRGKGYDLLFSTVVDNGGSGVRNSSGFTGAIRNVVSYGNTSGNFSGLAASQLFHCDGWATGKQGNSNQPPKFVDQKNGDLYPRLDSPLINAGAWKAGAEPRDLRGGSRRIDARLDGNDAPDIGAFESTPYVLHIAGQPKIGQSIAITLQGPAGQGLLVLGAPGNAASLHLPPFGYVLLDLRFPVLVVPVSISQPAVIPVPNSQALVGLVIAAQGLGVSTGNPWGALTPLWQDKLQ